MWPYVLSIRSNPAQLCTLQNSSGQERLQPLEFVCICVLLKSFNKFYVLFVSVYARVSGRTNGSNLAECGGFGCQGILSPEDARKAVDVGVDGIVVSNHGGRQLDYSPATLDMIAPIRAAVGHRVLLLMDGGIRRGTDVLKVTLRLLCVRQ